MPEPTPSPGPDVATHPVDRVAAPGTAARTTRCNAPARAARRGRPRDGAEPEELPTSVWVTAQADARTQRRGRYLPGSVNHPAKMLPAIAAYAVEHYTEPGQLVFGPDVRHRHHPRRARAA